VRFSPLITQVELDELELITDFEEFGIKETDNSSTKYESTPRAKKITIRYTSTILDKVVPEEIVKPKSINSNERDLVLSYFENIAEIVNSLKLEGNVSGLFAKIDTLDGDFGKLGKYKQGFGLTIKKMQNVLNQIRSYNIVRKELENKDLTDPANLKQKINVINQQLSEINKLQEMINREIKRIKTIY
ncbi:MAG: hypothetical protein ACXAAH_11365, partial [Promethearchaeota archaeon]